jgi:hypothetical protein
MSTNSEDRYSSAFPLISSERFCGLKIAGGVKQEISSGRKTKKAS